MVRGKRLAFVAALLIVVACQKKEPLKPAPAQPKSRATVVTIQTTLQPSKKTFTHTLVIAGGKARSLDELEAGVTERGEPRTRVQRPVGGQEDSPTHEVSAGARSSSSSAS